MLSRSLCRSVVEAEDRDKKGRQSHWHGPRLTVTVTSSRKQLNVGPLLVTHTPRGQTSRIRHDWLGLVRSRFTVLLRSPVTVRLKMQASASIFRTSRERIVPGVTVHLYTVVHGVDAQLIESLDGISTLSSSATKKQKSQEAPVLQIESASLERLRCDPSIIRGSASFQDQQHFLETQVANVIPLSRPLCQKLPLLWFKLLQQRSNK